MSVATSPRTTTTTEARAPSNRWGERRAGIGGILVLIGLWLFTALWALNYPQTGEAQSGHLNEIMVGIIMVWNGMARLVQEPTWVSDAIVLASGAWLIAAPFAVGYTSNSLAGSAMWADVITGIVIVALGLFSLLGLLAGRAQDVGEPGETRTGQTGATAGATGTSTS